MQWHSAAFYLLSLSSRQQVTTSLKEAEKDGVRVPQTVEEYTAAVQKQLGHTMSSSSYDADDMLDYEDDDYIESSEEEEEDGSGMECEQNEVARTAE